MSGMSFLRSLRPRRRRRSLVPAPISNLNDWLSYQRERESRTPRPYHFGQPLVDVETEPEELPPHRLPSDYALCPRCGSAPSSGKQHWVNWNTFYERRVLNLACSNGHRWSWSTDGG